MNMLRSISRFLLVIVLVLGVSCTPGKRITKANVEEVEEGMSKKQVESILGHPTSVTNEDPVIMKKTTYVYRQGKDSVTIVFKDDKVQSKESTLSELDLGYRGLDEHACSRRVGAENGRGNRALSA